MQNKFAIPKYISNFFWIFSERGFSLITGVLSSAFLARALSVENYGIFQYTLSIFSLFLAITYFCGSEYLTPKIAECSNTHQLSELVSSAFYVRLSFSIFSSILLILYLLSTKNGYFLIPLIIPLILKEPLSISINWFQASSKNKIPSNIQIFFSTVKLVIIVITYEKLKDNLLFFIIIYCIDFSISPLILFYFFKKYSKIKLVSFSSEKYLTTLKTSWKFGIGLIFMISLQKIDKIFLKESISSYDFGVYSTASQILENTFILVSLFIVLLAPSKVYTKDNINDIKKSVLELTKFSIAFYALIYFFFYLFSEVIFNLVFGAKFQDASKIFMRMGGILFFYTLDISLSTFFNKISHGGLIMKKWIFSLLISIILMLVLVPNHGINGAIISITIGYGFSSLYSLLNFIKYKPNIFIN